MSPWSSGPVRSQLLRVVRLVSMGVLLVGCTYSTEEPGLLGQTPASTVEPQPTVNQSRPVPTTNPALPVLGEELWTSADGHDVQVRIGIHALRRINGATVLDWSVTPLKAPNLLPGDPIPPSLDLGLSRRDDQRPRIYLLDARAGNLYRPLVSATGRPRCVCTPVSLAQRRLRIGQTALLQVAYPALPASSATIDVVMATVPPFWQVPVTRAGDLPVADQPTELGRPGDLALVSGGSSDMFRFGADEQIFRIQPNRILTSRTFTTLEWTIRSVTGGTGLDAASSPPFAEPAAALPEPADRVTASGPVLVVETDQSNRTLRTRMARFDRADPRALECLCSPLHGWTSVLRRPDKAVTVVTTYPPLPAGTERVQIRFRGLGVMTTEVTPAPSARSRAGDARPWSQRTWQPDDMGSELGWTSENWPTPVPAAHQLPKLGADPYRLVR